MVTNKRKCKTCKRFKRYNGDYETWMRRSIKLSKCTCNCKIDYEKEE